MKVLWLGWEDDSVIRRLRDSALTLGIELIFAHIQDVQFVADSPRLGLYLQHRNIVDECDVLVARPSHPHISEMLTVVRLFHDAGKPVIDQSLTDEGVALSKMHDYLILARHGLAVPRTWQVFDTVKIERLADDLGYPVVLKGIHGSYGTHVHLAQDAIALRNIQAEYAPGELMLQEYLPGQIDYRVIVIGYQTLPIIVERTAADGDFRTNTAIGGQSVPHPAESFPQLIQIAQQAALALRREFAAVDIRSGMTHPVVLEANRRPRFEHFELATNLDVAGSFLRHVRTRYDGNALHPTFG